MGFWQKLLDFDWMGNPHWGWISWWHKASRTPCVQHNRISPPIDRRKHKEKTSQLHQQPSKTRFPSVDVNFPRLFKPFFSLDTIKLITETKNYKNIKNDLKFSIHWRSEPEINSRKLSWKFEKRNKRSKKTR